MITDIQANLRDLYKLGKELKVYDYDLLHVVTMYHTTFLAIIT